MSSLLMGMPDLCVPGHTSCSLRCEEKLQSGLCWGFHTLRKCKEKPQRVIDHQTSLSGEECIFIQAWIEAVQDKPSSDGFVVRSSCSFKRDEKLCGMVSHQIGYSWGIHMQWNIKTNCSVCLFWHPSLVRHSVKKLPIMVPCQTGLWW